MKIKNVIIATFSVALLASCGGTDVCSCAEMGKEMMEDMLDFMKGRGSGIVYVLSKKER